MSVIAAEGVCKFGGDVENAVVTAEVIGLWDIDNLVRGTSVEAFAWNCELTVMDLQGGGYGAFVNVWFDGFEHELTSFVPVLLEDAFGSFDSV